MIRICIALFSALTLAASTTAAGQAPPSMAALRSACHVGKDKQPEGPKPSEYAGTGITPVSVSGAVTVSPAEAKCIIEKFSPSIVVADAADVGALPDSLNVSFAAPRAADSVAQTELVRILGNASAQNKAMPILVYCHNIACDLSYIAAQRIIAAGYSNVLWLREGSLGWKQAGFQDAGRSSRFRDEKWQSTWNTCLGDSVDRSVETDKDAILREAKKGCPEPDRAAAAMFLPTETVRKAVDSTYGWLSRRVDDRAAFNLAQGLNVPASDLVAGFEYCWIDADGYYFSKIYPSRIGRTGVGNSAFRSKYYSGPSQHGQQFVAKVIGPSAANRRIRGKCHWYPTLAEAQANYTRFTGRLSHVEFVDWTNSR